jgi:hypothetical protein
MQGSVELGGDGPLSGKGVIPPLVLRCIEGAHPPRKLLTGFPVKSSPLKNC